MSKTIEASNNGNPTLGVGAFELTKRFCQGFDEVRNFFRPRSQMGEFVSLSERREHSLKRVASSRKRYSKRQEGKETGKL